MDPYRRIKRGHRRAICHIVSTGCTSSTDAIGYVHRNIEAGVLSTMIAEASIHPSLIVRGFQLMRIMSTRWNHDATPASRPFSKDRDGFVIAEGAGSSSWRRCNRPRPAAPGFTGAAGYGSTCEAPSRSPGGVRRGARAGGTSTELNDRIETRAVKLAFNGHAEKLAGSSLKSMIAIHRAPAERPGSRRCCWRCATGWFFRDQRGEPDENCDLDYITDTGRRMHIEHAVADCIAFGSKNSAMMLRRA